MAIGFGTMVRLTLADTAGSLVAVAVKVTVFPVGTYAGAVYTMTISLPTWTGFSEPQATLAGSKAVFGLPPQFSVQSTPRFGPSFPTDALTFAVAPTTTEEIAGLGGLVSVTEIPPIVGRVEEHPESANAAKHKRERWKTCDKTARLEVYPEVVPEAT
jgi:hypothetical protein